MDSLEALRAALPEAAKDIKLNLQSVLTGQSTLNEAQRWGVALSSAYAAREPRVVSAVLAETSKLNNAHLIDDAKAAAVLMAMNNVYYRFVHLASNPEYGTLPAKLRMNAIATHGIEKDDFELFSLAVSAMNGCGMCIDSHERILQQHGVKSETIQAAARVGAVVKAVATVHATL